MRMMIVALLLAMARADKTDDKQGEENKRKIEKIARHILRETIRVDLTTMYTKHNRTVDQVITIMNRTLDYIDQNIEELKTHLETTIEEYDNNTMENLERVERNTALMLETMNRTMVTNLDNINKQSMDEHNDIISWAHGRAHLHEDILKTRITACAHDYSHYGEGVVTYNSNDGEYIKDSVSITVLNNTDLMAEDVLNRNTGIFKVPMNAAGEYMFTFTVTIDSYDQKLTPSSYFFAKNGTVIEGTELHARIGTSRKHDKTTGSRQVLLKLEEYDEVSVIQTLESDIADYHVSFCGALLHLDQASESPGGLYSYISSGNSFPNGTLAEQDMWSYGWPGYVELEDWTYAYAEKGFKPEARELLMVGRVDKTHWKSGNDTHWVV